MTEPLDAALDYYDRGLMPVPVHRVTEIRDGKPVCSCASRDNCASPGKHPTMAWSQFQRRRPPREEVADWWSGDRARYGVGILTGSASGNIFVLDVDIGPGKDGDDSLRALQLANGDLPETAEVRTGGGGLHLYFRAPPGVAVVRNSASKLGPGLDIRGEGGFVVAPPSFHASGQPYVWSWLNTLAEGIADAPAWLLDLVRAEPAVGPGPRERTASSPPPGAPVRAGSLGVLPPPVEDGREQYMRDTVFAVALELTGQNGAWPTADEIFEVAWPQFSRRVDLSRPGRITRDNAEPEMRAKCAQIAAKAERGDMGALEDVVAAYQAKRREQPRQGPGNRQEEAKRQERGTGFTVTWGPSLGPVEGANDFVEGLLCDASLAVLYGEPGSGKSFLALDLAAHVALGRPWRGRAVDQGAVVYVGLEGGAGIRRRVAAWINHHRVQPTSDDKFPLGVVLTALDLRDGRQAQELAEAIGVAAERLGQRLRLVVVDTLARAIAGGNENAPEDMGALVRGLGTIIMRTGAAVLGVHHPGKDLGRGMRGHSSLHGATDTEIEVARPEGSSVSTLRITKSKDLEVADLGAFRLEQVHLGADRRGRAITSAVALPTDAPEPKGKGKTTAKSLQVIRQALANAIAKDGRRVSDPDIPSSVLCTTVFTWRAEAYAASISDADTRDAQRKAFARASMSLLNSGAAAKRGEYVWLVP
jgi:hypothetical protein